MQANDEQNSRKQKLRKFQAQMEEDWRQGDARAKSIWRKYDKIEFEKNYKIILAIFLEKLIYEDISANISALAETVKSIKPDKTVDHSSYIATRLMKKAMWATTSSVKYLFVRRREYPPVQLRSRVIQFPHSASKSLAEDLSKIISSMTARDAAVFLGRLAGMYFKTCPREIYQDWREKMDKSPGALFSSMLFMTWTMEGELLMTIDF